jgi:hypothetical protein
MTKQPDSWSLRKEATAAGVVELMAETLPEQGARTRHSATRSGKGVAYDRPAPYMTLGST